MEFNCCFGVRCEQKVLPRYFRGTPETEESKGWCLVRQVVALQGAELGRILVNLNFKELRGEFWRMLWKLWMAFSIPKNDHFKLFWTCLTVCLNRKTSGLSYLAMSFFQVLTGSYEYLSSYFSLASSRWIFGCLLRSHEFRTFSTFKIGLFFFLDEINVLKASLKRQSRY